MRSMRNQKKAIGCAQRSAAQTAYVKRYDAPSNFAFPDQFDLSRYSLLLSESIRSPNQTTVLLYWISEERARAQEPVVEEALGITNAQAFGEVVQVLIPAEPKWTENPAKWGQWLITAAAIFGALSVIQDHFTELLGRPHVVIFADNAATTNFHAGDPIDIPLEVRNQGRLGHVDVHLDAAHLISSEASTSVAPFQFDISDVPQLLAGQNAKVHVSSSSPVLHNPKPQRYALDVQATAKEGYFWPAEKANNRPFTITLWPDHTYDIQVLQKSSAVARVEITLGSGVVLNAGLRGQLTFASRVPPETGGIVLMPGATEIDNPIVVVGSPDSLAKVSFQTGPLQPFRRYSVAVTIAFQYPLTESQWEYLRSSMKVTVG